LTKSITLEEVPTRELREV